MKTRTKTAVILVMTLVPGLNALAQQDTVFVANRDTAVTHYILSPKDMETVKHVIYVNEDVTTHIIMPENIKLVDISTAKIVGNQCADNMVRIKPRGRMSENELAGTVTLIGERHLAQYEMVYTGMPTKAKSSYVISQEELSRYDNPNVLMSEQDMAAYAWAIYSSKRKFNNIRYSASGIRAVVNNIYTIGDYFFIDYSLYNNTKIKYDIDELRIKLTDKKEVKATNSQTIELTPVYMLNKTRSFKGAYRNVIVIEKLTFPDEKVLKLEISENQISGRVIYLSIEYADILHADGFSEKMLKHLTSYPNK